MTPPPRAMNDASDPVDSNPRLPEAILSPRPSGGALASWWPVGGVVGLLVSVWLLLQGAGPTVTLVADHGHGIGQGDPVRYQGLDVGEVVDVRLAGAGVELELRMHEEARALARAGTRFWIVRPLLSLGAVEGLDTLLGARYVTLEPGPEGAEARSRFTALPVPPVAGGPAGLHLVLEARERHGLQPGAALTFRGVTVGTVRAVELSSDATAVEVHVVVERAYARLVRERSVFWETGGVEVDLTLTRGVELGLDSLRSAIVGSISMATPPDGGVVAPTGSRFALAEDAQPEWEGWNTPLPVGEELVRGSGRASEAFGAVLQWEEGRLLRSQRVREGWCCATPQGLIGPADLFTVPGDARGEAATVEVAGRRLGLAELVGQGLVEELPGGLKRVAPAAFRGHWGLVSARAVGLTRTLSEPEDVLIYSGAGTPPLAVSASRLELEPGGVARIVGEPTVPTGWHGGQVVSRADGAVLGLLVAGEAAGPPRVAPLPVE